MITRVCADMAHQVVTRAVDPFMMHPGNSRHWGKCCGRRKDTLRMIGMQMHLFPFGGRKCSGLRPYPIGDAYTTDIMEVRRDLETRGGSTIQAEAVGCRQ